jgi:hypothetical protein
VGQVISSLDYLVELSRKTRPHLRQNPHAFSRSISIERAFSFGGLTSSAPRFSRSFEANDLNRSRGLVSRRTAGQSASKPIIPGDNRWAGRGRPAGPALRRSPEPLSASRPPSCGRSGDLSLHPPPTRHKPLPRGLKRDGQKNRCRAGAGRCKQRSLLYRHYNRKDTNAFEESISERLVVQHELGCSSAVAGFCCAPTNPPAGAYVLAMAANSSRASCFLVQFRCSSSCGSTSSTAGLSAFRILSSVACRAILPSNSQSA